MGKFYFSLVVASVFVTTSLAQGLSPTINNSVFMKKTETFNVPNGVKTIQYKGIHSPIPQFRLTGDFSQGTVKKPMTEDDKIITDTPEGNLTSNAYGGAHGYYSQNFTLNDAITDGNVVEFVENGNDFYLKNPFSTIRTNTWIKGTKKAGKPGEPDSIIVNLPQPIYKVILYGSEGQDSLGTLYVKNIIFDENFPVSENQSLKFTWTGDTLKKVNKELMALVDLDDNWYGYGDDSITIARQKDVPVTLPATVEKSKYLLTYKDADDEEAQEVYKVIDIAKNGDDVYFSDLAENKYLWVKGSVEGDKVVFKKQYLGIDTVTHYHAYFVPSDIELVKFYGTIIGIECTERDNQIYSYDALTNKYVSTESFIINYGKHSLGTTKMLYFSPQIEPWEDLAYTPQDPKDIYVMNYLPGPDAGYGGVSFNIQTKDADGHVLDVNNLYYVVYIGNSEKPYTFTPDKYKGLKTEMSEVPVNFTLNYDFQVGGAARWVRMYDEDFPSDKVGIQLVYKGGNTTTKSEIVWYEDPSGINDAIKDSGMIKGVTYTDLSGRHIETPTSGLYIKTVKYSDGTTKSTKFIKR